MTIVYQLAGGIALYLAVWFIHGMFMDRKIQREIKINKEIKDKAMAHKLVVRYGIGLGYGTMDDVDIALQDKYFDTRMGARVWLHRIVDELFDALKEPEDQS